MRYNLLEEKWLPVSSSGGGTVMVAPWEVASRDDPPVDLAPPRWDFRLALYEFLIALVQTAMPPSDSDDWEDRLHEPPEPESFREALEPYKPFFNLFGSRPLFMQDFELEPDGNSCKIEPVKALLMDAAGDDEFFIIGAQRQSLCPACAAMALFTLQDFAPGGGRGHRTSLRGGGPLCSLVRGENLWDTVLRNTLPVGHGIVRAAPGPSALPGAVFPWAAPTRTSEKGEEVHPGDVHFLHAYWGMPRRIVLMPEQDKDGVCGVCGRASATVVKNYATRHSGYNYGPTWQHPLTPYRDQGPGKPALSMKGGAMRTGYTHWLGIVCGDPSAARFRVSPAMGVNHFRRHGFWEKVARSGIKTDVMAGGYQMDNMKPLQWCQGEYPFPAVAEDKVEEYRNRVESFVQAANGVRSNLAAAVKNALVSEGKRREIKANNTMQANIAAEFWAETETDFYRLAHACAEDPGLEATVAQRAQWADILKRIAGSIFDRHVMSDRFEPDQAKSVFKALIEMRKMNSGLLRKVLGLPKVKRGKAA